MKKTDIIGKKIRIIEMKDEPTYTGRIGIVDHVDGINQLHGTWGGLAIIPGTDKFEILEEEDSEES